jgi:hypothetical protein
MAAVRSMVVDWGTVSSSGSGAISGIGNGFSIRARISGSFNSVVRMISLARGAAAVDPPIPCCTTTAMA